MPTHDEKWEVLVQALVNKHPVLFKEHRTGNEPSPFSERGFEIDLGWFPIIDDLATSIEQLYGDEVSIFRVEQVKEKFGGLRFYYAISLEPDADVPGNDAPEDVQRYEQLEALVRGAEARCNATCEMCGAPGKLRTKRWMKTLCDEHQAFREQLWAKNDLSQDDA